MFVKMITLAAGPNGHWFPDTVYEVSDEFGAALVAGKYAVPMALNETGGYVPPLPAPVTPVVEPEPTPVVEALAAKTKKPKFYKSAE